MKFTIVVTVYKREVLFLHALYTVLQQDYKDWELIVLTDGPHPATEHAVELIKTDRYHAFWARPGVKDRIHFQALPKAPSGTVGNPLRRRGLELASGDYICFLGHDCLLDKDYLSTHLHNIQKEEGSCVSVVSALYWTEDPGMIRYTHDGSEVPVFPNVPSFIGKIPWSYTGKIDLAKATSGELDLTCFAMPTVEARQVGVFSPDMDYAYDADFQSFARLRTILPVVFTSKTVAGHF
tara:strand:+ start:53608 stop:54318 length:711 start_codon:yes stop_codon:yes gene_type:complete